MIKVNIFVGSALLETREFKTEQKAISFASTKQDEGFKVRLVLPENV